MNKTDVLDIYSENMRKIIMKISSKSVFKNSTDFELSVLKELISHQTKWLDVGCGTGYFLSQFPKIERAGLDISPFMLEEAKRVNPDALFFREGDFRNEYQEWKEQWTLITCMWNPYSYIDSLLEFEMMIANMITWTNLGGSIFIPIMDIEDFRFNTSITYEEKVEMYSGIVQINGFTWSWIEDNSNLNHSNMIAPHIEHVIRLLSPFFETIELIRYPPFCEGWVSRKAVLAKTKKHNQDEQSSQVIRHAIPPAFHKNENAEEKSLSETPELPITNRQLIGELFRRVKSGYLLRSVLRKIINR